VKFDCVRIFVIEIDNEIRTVVDYNIIFSTKFIVIIVVVFEKNLILKYFVNLVIVSIVGGDKT